MEKLDFFDIYIDAIFSHLSLKNIHSFLSNHTNEIKSTLVLLCFQSFLIQKLFFFTKSKIRNILTQMTIYVATETID